MVSKEIKEIERLSIIVLKKINIALDVYLKNNKVNIYEIVEV